MTDKAKQRWAVLFCGEHGIQLGPKDTLACGKDDGGYPCETLLGIVPVCPVSELEETDADLRSLRRELAGLLGPIAPKAGVTENDCWIVKVAEVLRRAEQAEQQAASMREALEFYAGQKGLGSVLASDGGKRAREALRLSQPLTDVDGVEKLLKIMQDADADLREVAAKQGMPGETARLTGEQSARCGGRGEIPTSQGNRRCGGCPDCEPQERFRGVLSSSVDPASKRGGQDLDDSCPTCGALPGEVGLFERLRSLIQQGGGER